MYFILLVYCILLRKITLNACDSNNLYFLFQLGKPQKKILFLMAGPLRKKQLYFNLFFQRPLNSRGGVQALMTRPLREVHFFAASPIQYLLNFTIKLIKYLNIYQLVLFYVFARLQFLVQHFATEMVENKRSSAVHHTDIKIVSFSFRFTNWID